MNLKLFGNALGELITNEVKSAGARLIYRIGTHKLPFIAKNGFGAELVYDLRYLPGYVLERATDKKNKALVAVMAAALAN